MRFTARTLLFYCSLTFLLVGAPIAAQSQDAFVTTWATTESEESIFIPTAPDTAYDFTIDWGDGTTESIQGVNPNPEHTYDRPGTYAVSITGSFPHIHCDDSPVYPFGDGDPGNARKLQTIEQWGAIEWISMEDAFAGAVHLTSNAEDTPNLSMVLTMDRMFAGATSFNSDLSDWDVSNVERMSALFAKAPLFNSDIGAWDVSSVEDMSGMFMHAEAFNQDISGWEVSTVTNMRTLFAQADAFNQDISGWDVSNVQDMSGMFMNADAFDQDISSWNVSNVTKMTAMFAGTRSFNQDIGNWNVKAVHDMRAMFAETILFNQDISGWEVLNVSDMTRMFNRAKSFNQDLSNWRIGRVRKMSFMFSGAKSLNQDLRDWYVPSSATAVNAFNDTPTYNLMQIPARFQ